MEPVLFFVVGAVVLVSAFGVVLARNPVHCALMLVATLIGVAVFFVMQRANLVAAVQVIVYASAIVVLFLFVIMLLGVDRHESLEDPVRYQRPAAVALGAILFVELLVLARGTWATGAHHVRGTINHGNDNIRRVGQALFTTFVWPFEVTAILLVIAVVGAVVLARRLARPENEDEQHEEVTTR